MSRGHLPGLASPHPLGERVPALYLDDPFALRLLEALDEVLAPVLGCLDNLEAYLDPDLAPEDFLQWLGGWVGLVLDESWPLGRRRASVREATALHRVRGTAVGLTAYVWLLTGAHVEIIESGATAFATVPDAPLPGSPGFELVVRLRLPEGASGVEVARLDALIAAAKPAHVAHRLEVVDAAAGGPVRPEPAGPSGWQPEDAAEPDETQP
jgi:phage tail-like protein